MALKVVILAAGKGTRMVANLPKVLHPLGGIPLLAHVIDTAKKITDSANIIIVYGNGASRVRETIADDSLQWVLQKEVLGTGHAVLQALPHCENNDQILVLYGDVPLISYQTLQYLVSESPLDGVGLLVRLVDDPSGLGRIVRNADDQIIKIVEHKDATESQLRIKEVNTGIMTASAALFRSWLPDLKNKNNQNEYYLTDVVSKAVRERRVVCGVEAFSDYEVQGVNDRWQLGKLERYYQRLKAKYHSMNGVTIKDPNRFDVRGRDVTIGKDVIIDVNVVLEGSVSIGAQTVIGPGVLLRDAVIGQGCKIGAYTIIDQAEVGDGCEVGPYANLQPGTSLSTKVKVGNFVGINNASVAAEKSVPHLTYVGDTS